jgi:hypothetical protein
VHYGPNLARPNYQPAGFEAERPALPRFRPNPMGGLPGWSPAGAAGQGEKIPFWCAHAGHRWCPTDLGTPVARRGGEVSMETRWCSDSGLGLRGERGSPADALHGGGDSKMGADSGSSDQGSRRPTAGLGSCLVLPHSLGRHAWGRTVAGGVVRRRGASYGGGDFSGALGVARSTP